MTGFDNPVYAFNYPDPQIVQKPDGSFLAVATNGGGMNVQTLSSPDMTNWTQAFDLLPQLPSWSAPGKVWAPEVIHWSDGYRLYYTTKAPDPEWQCISVARSSSLDEPFADVSTEPLVCEIDEGGSIDPSPFLDSSGRAWLYWKNDGNAVGVDTFIRVAPLSDDGLSLAGEPIDLFKQDLEWEGHLVEAPAVVEVDGLFHMFYSANDYGSDRYAVGHATASSPQGPFTKDPDPVIFSNDLAKGPGHNQLIHIEDQWWTVFHAWPPDAVGDETEGRQMWLSRVSFQGTSVNIDPPTQHIPARPVTTES